MDCTMNISGAGNRTLFARVSRLTRWGAPRLPLLLIGFLLPAGSWVQQPAEPVDISPIDGEMYYFINQLSGLQMDLDKDSISSGASILQQSRSFTSLSQRWALTELSTGVWAISN